MAPGLAWRASSDPEARRFAASEGIASPVLRRVADAEAVAIQVDLAR